MSGAVAPNTPCHVPNPHVVSECGLSELPSSIHSDAKAAHHILFVETCVEEVQNAEYATPQRPLVEESLDEGWDP